MSFLDEHSFDTTIEIDDTPVFASVEDGGDCVRFAYYLESPLSDAEEGDDYLISKFTVYGVKFSSFDDEDVAQKVVEENAPTEIPDDVLELFNLDFEIDSMLHYGKLSYDFDTFEHDLRASYEAEGVDPSDIDKTYVKKVYDRARRLGLA